MHEVCSRLQRETGALFDCFQQGDYVRIRTPFLYPDGDVIDLYYEEYDGMGTISDLGETVRWLGSQSASPRRSTGQKRIVEDVCLTTGVEFFRGMIQARVGKESDGLAGTLLRVAQAAVRVADIWFTFRARSIQSVNDDMATLLGDASIPFEQNISFTGRSGRSRLIDFHTRVPERSSFIIVLSTGSRSAAHALADRAVASWIDLNQYKVGPEGVRFITLFDDTMDIWGEEDFKLVEDVSKIARWSAPDEFLIELRAA